MSDTISMSTVEASCGTINATVPRLGDIPFHECEKRALEVALVGGHPIAMLFNAGSEAPLLIRSARNLAEAHGLPFHGLAYPWCRCGNFGSARHECRCSPRAIEQHLSRLGRRVDAFALWVASSPPSAHVRLSAYPAESEAAIMRRVSAARTAPRLGVHLDHACGDLLRAYMANISERLDVQGVTAIAGTIAALGGQRVIQVQHLAEALQYQPHTLAGFRDYIRAIPVETRYPAQAAQVGA